MKYFYYLLIAAFVGLIGYNLNKMDWTHWDAEKNWILLACALSGFCGLLLTSIMLLTPSKKKKEAIEEETNSEEQ